jgi:hypothetical protein
MNRENKLQSEKEKYHRFYDAVIIIAFLVIISLVITIPPTFEMLASEDPSELQINAMNNKNLETGEAKYADDSKKLETEYYVIVEKISEENIKSDENLVYPDFQLRGKSDTTNYTLLYVNEDGKVVRAENIKGIVWDTEE